MVARRLSMTNWLFAVSVVAIAATTFRSLGTQTSVHAQGPVLTLPGRFLPMRTGTTFTYDVRNRFGDRWELRAITSGFAQIRLNHTRYFTVDQLGYEWPGDIETFLLRSTSDAVYGYAGFGNEFLAFQDAPVGTTWTYVHFPRGEIIERSIEAIETVVTPAGTFDGCLRFLGRSITLDVIYTREWVKPGFGMVKEIDYYGGEDAPRVKRLKSWTR